MHFKFAKTTSREELQAIPQERKKQHLEGFAERVSYGVIRAAEQEKTTFRVSVSPKGYVDPISGANHGPLPGTNDEIVAVLTARFPGCSVEFVDEWVDVRPGVKEQRSGIKIDWS